MTRRLAAALAVLVCSGLAAGTPPAGAAKHMQMGVQDDPVFADGAYYDREKALDQAHAMGVTWLRINVSWWETAGASANSRKKPRHIVWDWRKEDSAIDAAARHGIRVQLTLTGPGPAWAMANHHLGVYGPRADLYGQWARAAAKHFKRRVTRYAIWNEPNHVGWMQPNDVSPALYRDVYVAGYNAIKRVDRKAQVLIGELVPYGRHKRALPPLEFLRDMSCATLVSPGTLHRQPRLSHGPCNPLHADGLADHPYDYQRPPSHPFPDRDSATVGSLGYLTGTLRALARVHALSAPHGKPLPVYLTEFGYFNSGHYKIAQSTRSRYLRQAYTIAARNPLVREMVQYSFITPPAGFLGGYFDLSLINRRGKPLPPYNALASWARTAARRGQIAKPIGAIKLPPAPAQ